MRKTVYRNRRRSKCPCPTIRVCLKFHHLSTRSKFHFILRYIFRRNFRLRLQNMPCLKLNLLAFAQTWKFKHTLIGFISNHQNNWIMKNNRYSLYSLIASAIVLLLGDVLQVLHHESILWTICLALSFVLFVGGIPAINSLIHTSNPAPINSSTTFHNGYFFAKNRAMHSKISPNG